MNSKDNKLCPSSSCREGAVLLGVVEAEGRVGLLEFLLPVDSAFVEKVQAQGEPEKRFRFAAKCVKSGCKQWDGGSCRVIGQLSEVNARVERDEVLKPCIIRPSCRWFYQEGAAACTICTYVVTDNR
jgi:hypothetical protein